MSELLATLQNVLMQGRILDINGARDISVDCLDEQGRLKVMPADYYRSCTSVERQMFCVRHGFYLLPTTELITWLSDFFNPSMVVVETAAGNGALGRALGIPSTDNFMQTWPEIKQMYEGMQQTPVQYGDNVLNFSANQVAETQPHLIIAAWQTHRFNEQEPWRGGNVYGVDEGHIIANSAYIHIGNRHVHRDKPVLARPHQEFEFDWLFSRKGNDSPDFIAVWEQGA